MKYSKNDRIFKPGDMIMCNCNYSPCFLKGVNYKIISIDFLFFGVDGDDYAFEIKGEDGYNGIEQIFTLYESDLKKFYTNIEARKIKLEKLQDETTM